MPTNPSHTYAYDSVVPAFNPEDAMQSQLPVTFKANLDLPAGQVVAQITATGAFADYDDGHSDGTEVARGILQYHVVTDSAGNVTSMNEWASVEGSPIWTQGVFRTAQLTGLDAAAVADLGRLIEGTVSAGLLSMK